MNKLFTKVAALTLGVAMAAGVGVSLGSAKVGEAKAASAAFTLSSASSVTVDGVTASFAKASGGNAPAWYAAGLRLYASNTVTISSANTITGITFNWENQGSKPFATATASVGEYSHPTAAGEGTWSGSANEVVFTLGSSGQLQLNTFSVTYNGDVPPATQYSVTDSVEHGIVSPTSVVEGGTLTATITPDSGFSVPESVTVTMGGETAAGATYSNGVVTLSNVTGAVVISGSCVAAPTPEHAGTQDDPYTVADARLAIDANTGLSNVYVRGIISGIATPWSSQFSNISFNISDDGLTTSPQLQAFRCVTSEQHAITGDSDVPTGAIVVMYGTLKKYNSTYELDAGCKIVEYTAPANPQLSLNPNSLEFVVGSEAKTTTVAWTSFSAQPTISIEGDPQYVSCSVNGLVVTVTPSAVGSEEVTIKGVNSSETATVKLAVVVTTAHGHVEDDPFTVEEALTAQPSAEVYVSGKISAISEVSTEHGNATYNISDNGEDTNSMIIYRGKYIGGDSFTSEDQIEVGGNVVVKGQLTEYKGKNQLAQGNELVSYVAPTPAKTLVSIAVTHQPTKTVYEIGEELDTAGLVVTATYSDESTETIESGLAFSGFDSSSAGQKTVTVTYEGKSATFNVTVSEPVLVGIEVTKLPTKVEYGYGEQFDPSGIEVTASYSVGEPKVVTEGLEYSGFDSEEVGSQTITVSYQGETAEFEVSVVIKDWLPEQKEAFVEHVGKELPFLGEAFVYSLQYDDDEGYFGGYAEGSYVNAIKSACSSWDYYYYDEAQEVHYITDPNGDGRAVLCFYEYSGYTVIQYWAEVVDHVLVAGGDFDYYVGDSLDVSSLVVYVVDKTETKGSQIPALQCSFSVTKFTEEGLVDIEIKYAYYYGTFQVLVSPVVATSLSLDVSSAIKTFKVGDEFDPTGVVSTLHFNNGSTQDVSDQVEYSGFDSSSVGEKTITVTYGDFEAEYVVNVVPAYDADSFGEEFLARISKICNGYDGWTNNKDALRTVWKTMEQRYLLSLSDAEKLRVINAKADENGSNLEKAMAFYDYACKKYRLDKFIENRVINAQVLEPETTNNNIPVIIALVSAIAGITLIGVIIAYRRRRSLYIK